jgi:hypothetical protein
MLSAWDWTTHWTLLNCRSEPRVCSLIDHRSALSAQPQPNDVVYSHSCVYGTSRSMDQTTRTAANFAKPPRILSYIQHRVYMHVSSKFYGVGTCRFCRIRVSHVFWQKLKSYKWIRTRNPSNFSNSRQPSTNYTLFKELQIVTRVYLHGIVRNSQNDGKHVNPLSILVESHHSAEVRSADGADLDRELAQWGKSRN